jgi:hypothetical protein
LLSTVQDILGLYDSIFSSTMADIDFNALPPAVQEQLLNGPALPPPEGIDSNFDDPPNRSDMAFIIYGVCFAIGTIFVLGRVWGTLRSAKKLHISDYLTLLAYGLYVGFMAIIFRQVQFGYFVHQWDIRLRDAPDLFYLFSVATNLFAVTIMVIKAAILLEWLRIFVPRGTKNYFYWISVVLLVLDVLFYSAAIIAINLTCRPHEKTWNRLLPGTCIDSRAIDITSAVINFFIDLVILVLPQKVIWGLNMSVEKRLGVSLVFIVGLIACFAAGFRLAVTVSYSKSQDLTYDFCTVGIWVVVETTCGLIVLCTPALPKALSSLGVQALYTSLKSWSRRTGSKRSEIELEAKSDHSNPYNKLSGHRNARSNPHGSETNFLDENTIYRQSQETRQNDGKLIDAAILRTTHIGVTVDDSGRSIRSAKGPKDPWAR